MPLGRPFAVPPFRSSARPLALALTAAAGLACADATEPRDRPVVAAIVVAGLVDTAGVGDTLRFIARARDSADANVPNVAMAWRSLTPAVASVDAVGTVVVRDTGDARLVVSAFGRALVEDTVAVRALLLPSRLLLAGLADSLALLARDTATATVQDGRGGTLAEPVRWAATDDWVLFVDSVTGAVVARSAGTAWVRATAGRARDSVRVVVSYLPVLAGRAWTQVAARSASRTLCALDADGRAWCATDGLGAPQPVPGAARLRELHGGQSQHCGLDAEARVYCFGINSNRVFGTAVREPFTSDSLHPGGGGHRWLQFALGDHQQACGVRAADSVVYCWGHNDTGQVGRLPIVGTDTLVAPVTGDLRATEVDLTGFSGCARRADGSVWCWGANWEYGRPDAGTLPIQMQPPGRFAAIATADGAVCGLDATGLAACWGDGVAGAPGSAPMGVPPATPRALDGGLRFVRLWGRALAADFCGLTAGGALHCWAARVMTPRAVLPGRVVLSVTLGLHRAAVTREGDAFRF